MIDFTTPVLEQLNSTQNTAIFKNHFVQGDKSDKI